MQLRGRKRSTAAAIAVIGSLLGGAVAAAPPGTLTAPSVPDVPTRAPGGGAAAPAANGTVGPVLDPGADTPGRPRTGPPCGPGRSR